MRQQKKRSRTTSNSPHSAIPGGFLLRDENGRLSPFRFRDYHSAERFVAMHPRASLTHLTRAWVIIREIDMVEMAPPLRLRASTAQAFAR